MINNQVWTPKSIIASVIDHISSGATSLKAGLVKHVHTIPSKRDSKFDIFKRRLRPSKNVQMAYDLNINHPIDVSIIIILAYSCVWALCWCEVLELHENVGIQNNKGGLQMNIHVMRNTTSRELDYIVMIKLMA